VHAKLVANDVLMADVFWFPAGLPSDREADIGLTASIEQGGDDASVLRIGTRRFAQTVFLHAPGYLPEDNGFHLAPGQTRTVGLRPHGDPQRRRAHGNAVALNAEISAGFALP
ncbi:MAG TPA: glycoside hydrolase family 2 protein, partial [Rhodanobacteraceae bacterium]|nr:glycoside hydrolase family 2 protein [Rhodanobacteraceae bacterium]